MIDAYNILVTKPGRKRTFGTPRRIRENNIKRNLRETVLQIVDWICLV
jgi:hypothetical protein